MAARKVFTNDEIVFENNLSDPDEDIEEDSPPFCQTENETRAVSTFALAANLKLKPETDNQNYGEDAGPTIGVLFKNQQSANNKSNPSVPLSGFQNDRAQEISVQEDSRFRDNKSDLDETGHSVFSSGWELKDKEFKCLPLISRVCIKTDSADRKTEAEKDKPSRGLRLLNKRSKKWGYGSTSRMKYTSVMGMLATVAKAYGLDVAMLFEESEHVLGSKGNMRLPCMQCYEKGESGGGGLTGAESLMESPFGNETGADGDENRCSKCGGLVQTLASFGKMISKMRSVLQEKELIPHDVYPDGNCMFAAVVDQLRIRGDFTFTMHTLRDAAVQYLRQNPTSDDGTPLEMFLANDETWETYLTRMSEDGEWGDHIVLSALSNVTGMPISIFGGMSGQEKTFIYPSATSKDQEVQLDTDKLVEDSPVIYLGHVGESHYMSLRPKRWRQLLLEDTKMKAAKETVNERCPVQQIDFILRQAFRMEFIKSRDCKYVDMIGSIMDESNKDGYKLNMVGSVMCMMVPSKSTREQGDDLLPDISIFFPIVKENEMNTLSERSVLTFLKTPEDTKIVFSKPEANAVDLVAENHKASGGQLCLIPKQPSVWSGQIVKLSDQRLCLNTFELNIRNTMYESLRKVIPSIAQKKSPDVKHIIAFKCSWPPHAAEWPFRRRQAGFPDEKTIHTVLEEGCHVVPYTTDRMFDDIYDYPSSYRKPTDNHTWSFTFASAEKEISRFLTAEQRQCFLLFKFWVDMATNEPSIPNSVLRSIFFNACENIAKAVWKSKPGECLLVLLKKLEECLMKEHAPHYFLANKNLLEEIPRENFSKWYEQLQVSLLQPVVTLYFVLDQLDVLSSEMGRFLEEIMEETNRVQTHASETLDFHEALVPVCSTLLASLITQKDYERAMFILQDMAGQNKNTDLSYLDALKKSCWHIHIRDQWCFAFFIDIRMNTKLTMNLCEGYASVSITEVFGPECTEELPDTLVPETSQISNGDIGFAYDVSEVLSLCVSTKCYIKSFKYYLKKYAEYAGDALVLPCENVENVYITKSTGSLSEKQKGMITSAMAGQSLLLALNDLYVILFNTCLNSNKVEEFREMMPVMTKIVEELNTPTSCSNLQRMWTYLGEMGKAEQVNVPTRGRQSKKYMLYLWE